jgi:DNA-binding beta-propeller fold protein YncE
MLVQEHQDQGAEVTRSVGFLTAAVILNLAPAIRAEKLVVFAADKPADGGVSLPGLKQPFAIDFDRAGNSYVADMTGNRIWKIDATGTAMLLAGTGEKGDSGDGGPGTKAMLNGPHSLVVTPAGDVLVADTWNNRARKIDGKTGVISAFAGTGKKGFSGDGGPAVKAEFGGVYCVALAPDGKRLVIADLDNRRVRSIDIANGVVTTVAGNGKKGVPENGATASEAPLVDPRAVTADAAGNVYILERSGHALRVVSADGHVRTVAGTGKAGPPGDGEAKSASMNGPKHLCVDRAGSVLIADTENHCIRRYEPNEGRIVRIAGTGKKGSAGIGGPPESAELSQPHGVTVGPDGTIYICDSSNHRVLKVVP